ncbi:hypothetical protein BU26DRAFT_525868 [Trematosphaeria pertusa]|uniref:Uncharacterized protein n=1 Tax=Trematosphaeria pertusa TaxID=390896 RepID=A0A6A6HR69_9PLEO|nr:uncharacterized protein BU26DRAFT_525868 [Trematosphaeria pertusa]KAF2240645.1 hypothetical protein BU26DRAFT_525868 [Trematosphaeria pertusa]
MTLSVAAYWVGGGSALGEIEGFVRPGRGAARLVVWLVGGMWVEDGDASDDWMGGSSLVRACGRLVPLIEQFEQFVRILEDVVSAASSSKRG